MKHLPSRVSSTLYKTIRLVVATSTTAQSANAAKQCSMSSGNQHIPLVELYTSEGCSSCPPADSWLSKSVIPYAGKGQISALAWHVDYWDQLGWRDRFANPSYSNRQREQARLGRLRSIYTPQVTLDGIDKPSWRFASVKTLALQSREKSSDITIKLDVDASNKTVQTDVQGLNDAQWYLALYQDGLSSKVLSGENGGTKLEHDRVVRVLKGPYHNTGSEKVKLETPSDFEWKNGGVVAFVQRSGEVVQSLSLPFANCANE